MVTALAPLAILGLALLALPPLGALLSGIPLGELLAFPLDARSWDPLPFDPNAFAWGCAIAGASVLIPLWLARPRGGSGPGSRGFEAAPTRSASTLLALRLLVWGLLLLSGALALALAGLPGLSQPALILGLTLALAGHSERRIGSSLLSKRPGYFVLLYPASALLGWLIHWLNLFLQLWVYPGAGAESAIPFVLVRTLDYATLLPALLILRQWLASWRPLLLWCSRGRHLGGPPAEAMAVSGHRHEAALWLALAGMGLLGAAIWPDYIWPLTWLAPLLLVIGLQRALERPTPWAGIRGGDWSRVLIPALAALLLGLLIQGWNGLMGPAWVFRFPLIQGGTLFGLPLPAYAGLPPLALLGVWVADQLAHPWRRRPLGRFRPFPVRLSINR